MSRYINWSKYPEYGQLIAERRAAGDSWPEVASKLREQFGIPASDETARSWARRTGFEDPPVVVPALTPQEKFSQKVASERERAETRAVAAEMAAAVKAAARWNEFIEIVQGALESTPRAKLEQLTVHQGTGTPETMVVLIGDIHIGKLVDPAVVGDGFGYGIPIFESRWARLKDRILRLYSLHSLTAPIEKLRIYFLGDGVDGVDMRRGHAHRVDVQTATRQCLILVYSFEGMVRELSQLLGIPIEIIWDFGNHGRVGDFGVNLPADNWDFIAGQMLGIALRDLTATGAVKLSATEQKYTITNLGPYRVHSAHGDAVRGGDGFAGLPINGLARALAKDTGLHLQLFDLYLTAHFHTPQDITTQAGRIIMNGAWDGGDDYSINQLKAASEPVQFAFGIHPQKGMTWQSRIHLAPRRLPSIPEDL